MSQRKEETKPAGTEICAEVKERKRENNDSSAHDKNEFFRYESGKPGEQGCDQRRPAEDGLNQCVSHTRSSTPNRTRHDIFLQPMAHRPAVAKQHPRS